MKQNTPRIPRIGQRVIVNTGVSKDQPGTVIDNNVMTGTMRNHRQIKVKLDTDEIGYWPESWLTWGDRNEHTERAAMRLCRRNQ